MSEQDLDFSQREAKNQDFLDEYGIDPGSASVLFESGPLKTMLEHMYYDAMEALRDCELASEGQGIQGQAKLLWTILEIPNKVNELKTLG